MAKGQREQKYLVSPAIILKTETQAAGNAQFGVVESVISVLGIVDSHDDRIDLGSYVKTLSESSHRVKLLDNHRWESGTDILGSPQRLRELNRSQFAAAYPKAAADMAAKFPDYTGVVVAESRYNLQTLKGHDIYHLIAAGDLSEYSVGIRLLQWKQGESKTKSGVPFPIRIITEVELVEYSTVIRGANPGTMTLADYQPPATDIRLDELLNLSDTDDTADTSADVTTDAETDDAEASATTSDSDDDPETPNGLDNADADTQTGDAPGETPTSETTPSPVPQPQATAQQPIPQPTETEMLISQSLSVVRDTLNHDTYDLTAARRVEKTLAGILTPRLMKAMSLRDRDQSVRMQFYRQFPDDYEGGYLWFCRDVFETTLTVYNAFDIKIGRHFAIDYQIDDDQIVTFAPMTEWREGRYEFVESAPLSSDSDESETALGEAEPVPAPAAPLTSTSTDDDLAKRRQAGLERLKNQQAQLALERK